MNSTTAPPRFKDRDLIAALLSVVPGAGHLYKHHYASGIGLLVGGNLLVILVATIMALGTLGLSVIIVPTIWIASVAAVAYALPDWHGHHHYLHPWADEVEEEEDQ